MKYKITYWNNGNQLTIEAEAETMAQAKLWFLLCTAHDDIESIKEVK